MVNVALEKLSKCFAIFDCKVSNTSESKFISFWLQDLSGISSDENRIYNIYDFETFNIKNKKINPDSIIYNCIPKMKDIQVIINWIRDDILKEEINTILENNITTKDIIRY